MTIPMNSLQFERLLDARLRKVYENEWGDIEEQRKMLFGEVSSDSAWEEYTSVGAVPDIPDFSGRVDYLQIAPGFLTRIEPKEFAGGLAFERKLLDDKKYNVMDDRVGALTRAAKRVYEKNAVEMFANAFSSANTFMFSEEGVSLCNSAHLTKSGASTASGFNNTGTSALSKTALAAAWLTMRQYRGDVAERIDVNPDTLVVPESLYFTALEIVGKDPQTGAESMKDPDSAMHRINSQYGRFKVVPLRRLDDYSTKNWFLVDSKAMKRHLLWIERVKPDTKTTVDFETFEAKWSIYFRIGCGFTDWRWIYGSQVS